MFSVSDIKQETYQAAYRRGKELYERGAVSDFSYEVYCVGEFPKAEVAAKVRGNEKPYYHVEMEIDEEFGEVSNSRCECEAFYNYEGLCKHCVAALFSYVNRRRAADILKVKNGEAEEKEQAISQEVNLRTSNSLKMLLNHYSMRAGTVYLLPENIYGKVELEPYFKMNYGFATVEFKIGAEQKYVLKNISAFLDSLRNNEKVRYGKKLEFYHHMEAFTETAKRMIQFLQIQEADKRRQSKFHAYYTYTGGYERTMELDGLGIDRFFEAVGTEPFTAEIGFLPEEQFRVAEEEKQPKLHIKQGGSGIFLLLEDLQVIHGEKYVYFYEDSLIYRSKPGLKGKIYDFFEFLNRQTGGECYVAEEELPMFCRDLLPLIRENFTVVSEGFDESLYVPPKPEFELYLDKRDANTVGARLMAVYGEEKYNVLEKVGPGEVRDVAEELRTRNLVEPYFNDYTMGQTVFVLSRNEDMLYQLLTGGLRRLSDYMTIYTSEGFRNMKVVSSPGVSVGVSLKSDLLELEIHSPEMSQEELAYLLSKYDKKKKYIRLKNGDFLDIEDDGLGVLAEVSEDLRLTEANLKKGKIIAPKYRAMYLDAALKSNHVLSVEKNREFKGMVRNMKTIEDSDFEIPASLKGIMRSYQKNGFLWLKTLRENGFGGILADDMGLGKTLQVISLLLSEQEEVKAGEKEPKPSLIVCPASLVYNWQKEVKRFAPELNTQIVAGSAAERRELVKKSEKQQILITSYDLLKRDVELYRDMVFAVQVIDEAQYIKNPSTQAAKAVKKMTAAFKLALTGTPIENRLSELWSIFDYLMPGFLYTYQRFREEIELPIVTNQDENKMERLQRMIRPFILRRLKGDVLKDLPEKLEENVFAKLAGEQMQLYDAHVQQMKEMLDGKSEEEFRENKIQILSELTKLRQLCCDPSLLFEDYSGESAKTDMCMELILNAVNGGHKVLLFSQFTSMLDRLGERLKKEGIAYYMLTGSVSKEKRMQMVESFATDEVLVFAISLKAGGTGLNLTAADIVIHYDPWWNVAVQNQATDRAHRIGQKNVVTVYKLVAEGTIEEKIIAIQERKKQLARQVLEGEGMDTATFTREEILELLG
ncbi:MAG: SNF2 helicase associated domain-containing protein [Clostridiales bacterium]|nr:SNF2 helicase associated domain-containing protein [Clostridiales bacterium]